MFSHEEQLLNNNKIITTTSEITRNERDLRLRARAKPKPIETLLLGAPRGIMASFVGIGAIGKSTLVQQMLLEACGYTLTNTGLRGTISNVKAAYFPVEDPDAPSWHRDYNFLSKLNDEQLDLICNNFVVNDLYNETPDIMSTYWAEYLSYYAAKYDILFLDTFRCFHNKNELDGSEMDIVTKQIITIAKKFNIIVGFTHHSSKEAGKSSDLSQFACKGSAVLVDHSKWNAVVGNVADSVFLDYGLLNLKDDEKKHYCALAMPKANFSNNKEVFLYKRISSNIPDIAACTFKKIEKQSMKQELEERRTEKDKRKKINYGNRVKEK
ncbi:helicase RepA family protein [Endozoicomonas euniceicola]|uniref:Helicase RepA family protein n=1 Tax=Endozoicomonas euniceicola TaxID=1234143 RepID=A0ABY6H0Z3_9GAMM|nr:helicase RepA family protein [Endozoicomonas euniceicola]UYM18585.1 helicase RepA family protein [Endozoicomonas euniceicola]